MMMIFSIKETAPEWSGELPEAQPSRTPDSAQILWLGPVSSLFNMPLYSYIEWSYIPLFSFTLAVLKWLHEFLKEVILAGHFRKARAIWLNLKAGNCLFNTGQPSLSSVWSTFIYYLNHLHNNPRRQMLLWLPFYRWRNRSTEMGRAKFAQWVTGPGLKSGSVVPELR